MKLVNPLHYPLAVLPGAIVLIVGVRIAGLPYVSLPVAAAIAVGGASYLQSRESETAAVDPALAQELDAIHTAAQSVADKANTLRQEANRLLAEQSYQLEFLSTVQYACDRAQELPTKIERMSRKFQGADSLLSASELQQQLQEVQNKISQSSGASKAQLQELEKTLQNNLQLAEQGKDSRQAQAISLHTLVQNSAGVLQQLQNKIQTANLEDDQQVTELQNLSNELKSFQENVDILVRQ
jgi:DNA repair exonuclease SbcCD ATPase subunit